MSTWSPPGGAPPPPPPPVPAWAPPPAGATSWAPPTTQPWPYGAGPVPAATSPPSRTAIALAFAIIAVLAALVVFSVSGEEGPSGVSVRTLAVGDCYVQTGHAAEDGVQVPYGQPTACNAGATRRVYAHVPASGLGYPGPELLREQAIMVCGATGAFDQMLLPSAESWSEGDRMTYCFGPP